MVSNNTIDGKWTSQEQLIAINELDLAAILFGIKYFLLKHEDTVHVKITTDNTIEATLSYQSGIQFFSCDKVTKEIWTVY